MLVRSVQQYITIHILTAVTERYLINKDPMIEAPIKTLELLYDANCFRKRNLPQEKFASVDYLPDR